MQDTRQHIIEILKTRGQATVDELAVDLSLTPMTVRHHLAILEQRELVVTEARRGKVGRPYHIYRLTPAGDDLFPKSYHLLAERVLAKIKEQYGLEEARAILKAIALDLALSHGPERDDAPLAERLVRVEDIMAAEGFRVRVKTEGNAPGIELCNCAYRSVAAQHPEVCELDHMLMEDILGQPLERVKHTVAGDDCCRYELACSHQTIGEPVGSHGRRLGDL